jgi:peptide/nickel transport system permease protein
MPPGLSVWLRLLGRRLSYFALTLLLILSITWLLTRVVGGNPAYGLAGGEPTPAVVHSIDQKLGLNKPLLDQYFSYLGDLFTLHLGTDYFTSQSVGSELLQRAPATIELVGVGGLFALIFGLGLGIISAMRRGKAVDHAGRLVSTIALSTPDFLMGLVLIFLVFYEIHIFPAPIGQLPAGVNPPRSITGFVLIDGFLTGHPGLSWDFAKQLFLPAITFGLVYFVPIYRLTRASLLETLRSDSVLYARACGLPRKMILRYALRQSMTVVVTSLGLLIASLIGGDVLIEQVFSWGGIGQLGVAAVTDSNYPLVQGFVLVVGVSALVIYTLVDIAYMVIDPRVRFGR